MKKIYFLFLIAFLMSVIPVVSAQTCGDTKVYYEFNSSSATDFSGCGNDGVVNGPATSTYAEAWVFDGQDDWVNSTVSPKQQVGAKTIGAKFNTNTDFSSKAYIVHKSGVTGGACRFESDDKIHCYVNDGSFQSVSSGTGLNDGQNHTVVLQVDPGNEMELFIDGSSVDTRPIGTISGNGDGAFGVGATIDSSYNVFDFFDGSIWASKYSETVISDSTASSWFLDADSGGGGSANSAPTLSNFDPVDGATAVNDTNNGTGIDVNTSLVVSDSDNSTLSWVALKWGNGTIYYNESNVANNSKVEYQIEDLDSGSSYDWKAEASDGISTTNSVNKTFTTASESSFSHVSIGDWEENSLSKFTGDTSLYNISTVNPYEGSYSLRYEGGSENIIWRNQNSYSPNLTTWELIRFEKGSDFNNTGIIFGLQDKQNFYFLNIVNQDSDRLRFYKRDAGSYTKLKNAGNLQQSTFPTEEYVNLTTTWYNNGTMVGRVKDVSNGSALAKISTTDTAYSSGYLGFRSTTANVTFDASTGSDTLSTGSNDSTGGDNDTGEFHTYSSGIVTLNITDEVKSFYNEDRVYLDLYRDGNFVSTSWIELEQNGDVIGDKDVNISSISSMQLSNFTQVNVTFNDTTSSNQFKTKIKLNEYGYGVSPGFDSGTRTLEDLRIYRHYQSNVDTIQSLEKIDTGYQATYGKAQIQNWAVGEDYHLPYLKFEKPYELVTPTVIKNWYPKLERTGGNTVRFTDLDDGNETTVSGPFYYGYTSSVVAPNSSYLFEKSNDAMSSWIDSKPNQNLPTGWTTWDWGDKGPFNSQNVQENFVDYGSNNGATWHTVDRGWYEGSGTDPCTSNTNLYSNGFQDFTSYAHDKEISVMAWVNFRHMRENQGINKSLWCVKNKFQADGVKTDGNVWKTLDYNEDVIDFARDQRDVFEYSYDYSLAVDLHGGTTWASGYKYPNIYMAEQFAGGEETNRPRVKDLLSYRLVRPFKTGIDTAPFNLDLTYDFSGKDVTGTQMKTITAMYVLYDEMFFTSSKVSELNNSKAEELLNSFGVNNSVKDREMVKGDIPYNATFFVEMENGDYYFPTLTWNTSSGASVPIGKYLPSGTYTVEEWSSYSNTEINKSSKTISVSESTTYSTDSMQSNDGNLLYIHSTSSDTTPPTSSDNWTDTGFVDKSEVDVELTASDNSGGSGVANISYSVNGGSYSTVSGSSTLVTISQQQNNTLEYYATDNAGNQESVNTEYVALDTSATDNPPSVSLQLNATIIKENESVEAQVSASDDFQLDSVALDWTGDGTFEESSSSSSLTASRQFQSTGIYSVTARATDNNSQTSTTSKTLEVDPKITSTNKSVIPTCTNAGQDDAFCITNSTNKKTFSNGFTPEDNTTVSMEVEPRVSSGEYKFFGYANSTGTHNELVESGKYNVTVLDSSNLSNQLPFADFSISPSSPVAGESITFDGSSSNDDDGTISAYRWDWTGDGAFEDTGETASHTYSSSGDYSVSLEVEDNDGATSTVTKSVSVGSSDSGGGGGGGNDGGDDGGTTDPGGGDENTSTGGTVSLGSSEAKLLTPHLGGRYGDGSTVIQEGNSKTVLLSGKEVQIFAREVYNTSSAKIQVGDNGNKTFSEGQQIDVPSLENAYLVDVVDASEKYIVLSTQPFLTLLLEPEDVRFSYNYSVDSGVGIATQYRKTGFENNWKNLTKKNYSSSGSGLNKSAVLAADTDIYEGRLMLYNDSTSKTTEPIGFFTGEVPELDIVRPAQGKTVTRLKSASTNLPIEFEAFTYNETNFGTYYVDNNGDLYNDFALQKREITEDNLFSGVSGVYTRQALEFIYNIGVYEFVLGAGPRKDINVAVKILNIPGNKDGVYTAYVNASSNRSSDFSDVTSIGRSVEIDIIDNQNQTYVDNERDALNTLGRYSNVTTDPQEDSNLSQNVTVNGTSGEFRSPYWWLKLPSNKSTHTLNPDGDSLDFYFDMGHEGNISVNKYLVIEKSDSKVAEIQLISSQSSFNVSVPNTELSEDSWSPGNYTWYLRFESDSKTYSTENRTEGELVFTAEKPSLRSLFSRWFDPVIEGVTTVYDFGTDHVKFWIALITTGGGFIGFKANKKDFVANIWAIVGFVFFSWYGFIPGSIQAMAVTLASFWLVIRFWRGEYSI